MSPMHSQKAPKLWVTLGSGLLLSASAASAAAQGSDSLRPAQSGDYGSTPSPRAARRDPFALDVTANTLVPLSIGPEVTVELPGRVLAQVHVGWMPELYSETLTDSLEDAGVYDAAVGALIDGALQSATTWRLAAGWRPFASAGLELTAGYAHVSLDGATTTGEITPLVDDEVAERLDAEIGDVGLTLDSSIHHLTLGAGWRWLLADRVVIRAHVGYLQAFDSSSSLDIEGFSELTELASPAVESVLHDHYMRYVRIPVVGLGVGYRFF